MPNCCWPATSRAVLRPALSPRLWRPQAAAVSSFAGYTLADPFKSGGPYWRDGTAHASITGVPGYTYSDSGDNLPAIDASGYHSDAADNAILRTNIHNDGSALADEDLLIFVRATVASYSGTDFQTLLYLGSGTNYVHLYRNIYSSTAFGDVVVSSAMTNCNIGVPLAAGVESVLVCRRLGGLTQIGCYTDGTLTWAATNLAGFPSGMTQIYVGNYNTGGEPTLGAIAGAFILSGSFDDAACIALFEATA